jgi:hypothetical protein
MTQRTARIPLAGARGPSWRAGRSGAVVLVERVADTAECLDGRQGPESQSADLAELRRLIDDVRRLAYDRTLDDADRARRIRDRFGEHDGRFDDDC